MPKECKNYLNDIECCKAAREACWFNYEIANPPKGTSHFQISREELCSKRLQQVEAVRVYARSKGLSIQLKFEIPYPFPVRSISAYSHAVMDEISICLVFLPKGFN